MEGLVERGAAVLEAGGVCSEGVIWDGAGAGTGGVSLEGVVLGGATAEANGASLWFDFVDLVLEVRVNMARREVGEAAQKEAVTCCCVL